MKASDQIVSLRDSIIRNALRSDIPWPWANTLLDWLEDLRQEVEELKTKPPVLSTLRVELERSKLRVTELENQLSVQIKNNGHLEHQLNLLTDNRNRWHSEACKQALRCKEANDKLAAARRSACDQVPSAVVANLEQQLSRAQLFAGTVRAIALRRGETIDWPAVVRLADEVLDDQPEVSEPPVQQFPPNMGSTLRRSGNAYVPSLSPLERIMTRATEHMMKLLEREVLDPVRNPKGISSLQVPKGWRLLRESDFKQAGHGQLKRPLTLQYWWVSRELWDPLARPTLWASLEDTYITPTGAEPTERPEPAPKVLNPEKVDPAKVPEGWRFITVEDKPGDQLSRSLGPMGFAFYPATERVRNFFRPEWTYVVPK